MNNSPATLRINRSMPACTIIPVLEYPDIDQAILWLTRIFGFSERWRAGAHRAQMSFGDGAIALSASSAVTPWVEQSHNRHSLLVRVPDVLSHFEHTRAAGAQIIQSPADFPYGEKQYSVKDIGGHVWVFSQSIADVAPEEWGGTIATGSSPNSTTP